MLLLLLILLFHHWHSECSLLCIPWMLLSSVTLYEHSIF
jgi:hypothetical protein